MSSPQSNLNLGPVNTTSGPNGYGQLPNLGLPNGDGTSSPVAIGRPGPPASFGQTIKPFVGVVTTTGALVSTTLETVTTGKTLFITDVVLTTDDTTDVNVLCSITAGGTTMLNGTINGTKGLEMLAILTAPQCPSGSLVALNVTAATSGKHVYYNIYGYES